MTIFSKELSPSGYIKKLNKKAKLYGMTLKEPDSEVRRKYKLHVLYSEINNLSNFDELSASHKDAIVATGISYLTEIMSKTNGRYDASGDEDFNRCTIYFLSRCEHLNSSHHHLIEEFGQVEYQDNQAFLHFHTLLEGFYSTSLENFKLVLSNIFKNDKGYNIWILLESTALYKLDDAKIDFIQKLTLKTCTEIDYSELNNYGAPLVADIVNKIGIFNLYKSIHEPESIAYLGMFYKDLIDYRMNVADPNDSDFQSLRFSEQVLKNMLNPLVDMKLNSILKVIELTDSNTFEHWVATVIKEETPVVDFDFN